MTRPKKAPPAPYVRPPKNALALAHLADRAAHTLAVSSVVPGIGRDAALLVSLAGGLERLAAAVLEQDNDPATLAVLAVLLDRPDLAPASES